MGHRGATSRPVLLAERTDAARGTEQQEKLVLSQVLRPSDGVQRKTKTLHVQIILLCPRGLPLLWCQENLFISGLTGSQQSKHSRISSQGLPLFSTTWFKSPKSHSGVSSFNLFTSSESPESLKRTLHVPSVSCLLSIVSLFSPTDQQFPLLLLLPLQCWDQCASPPTKINTSIQETWPLRVITMIRQGSLVSADVAWPEAKEATQCLVTWEVSGGGLMGNLLTDSASVELSLWPETKYRVQVTCKNKVSPRAVVVARRDY